eukprot:jgi/Chlat1/1877/Chrsp143S02200
MAAKALLPLLSVALLVAAVWAASAAPSSLEGRTEALRHATEAQADLEAAFVTWCVKYGKSYASVEEHEAAFTRWKATVERVMKHNQDENASYWMAVNARADMDASFLPSLQKHHEGAHAINTNATLVAKDEAIYMANLPADYYGICPTPDAMDWRQYGAVTAIKDQGEAPTGAVEAINFITTGELVSLSEQQLVDCDSLYSTDGCNGGSTPGAYEWMVDNGGLAGEDSYQYTAQKGACQPRSELVCHHSTFAGISRPSAVWLDGDSTIRVGAWALSLTACGVQFVCKQPISVGLRVTDSFHSYQGGVYTGDDDCQTGDINHAVLIVGFGTDEYTGLSYWLIKNQWGTWWGEDARLESTHASAFTSSSISAPTTSFSIPAPTTSFTIASTTTSFSISTPTSTTASTPTSALAFTPTSSASVSTASSPSSP